MHPRHTSLPQPINRQRQLLTQPLLFNLRDGVHVRFEREDERLGVWEAVERLALAAEVGLLYFLVNGEKDLEEEGMRRE